jgi:DNA repair protein RecO (recombination protein O)
MALEAEGHFLILRKVKYGEADLIIQALSHEGEKMSFIARGALRSKKRFGGGVLEPTHHVKIVFVRSPKSELLTMKEAQLLQGFDLIRKDYDKLEFALSALAVVAHVSMEGDNHSSTLYNLLGHLLKRIETTTGTQELDVIKVQFYLKFLLQQGVLEIEDWMPPFLKLTLQESQTQDAIDSLHDIAHRRLSALEKSVRQYTQNASF